MSSELYDALVEAGASQEKARHAAAAVATYDARFARLNTNWSHLKWSLGIGFSVVISLMLVALNWWGQRLQRVHGRCHIPPIALSEACIYCAPACTPETPQTQPHKPRPCDFPYVMPFDKMAT
jgi:hypothetical protein